MLTISGLPTARGFASGPVYLYHGEGDLPIPEYQIEKGHENEEMLRFRRAQMETRRDLESLVSVLRERSGRGDVMVFECHLMLLEDPLLVGAIERNVVEGRLNAEAAVRKAVNEARVQFERMNDPYFRERVRDLDDVERRLQKALLGFGGATPLELTSPAIIVADELTPSETVRLPREFVLGFATNGGSTTSHVALLARAMGIPAVSGLGNITTLVAPGDTMLLDGSSGGVCINPDKSAILSFRDLIERQRELSEEVGSGAPSGTLKGGGEVLLYANVHPGLPVSDVRALGARGVGLYRSEYLWINRDLEPTEEEQFAAYREAAELTRELGPDATLTIRTLDIGGDKTVRGISAREANPFLGNRSIRYSLSRPDSFRVQVRAILRASAFGKVRLMYPMISCVEELRQAAAFLEEEKGRLVAEGIDFDRDLPVGAMIEVPAAAINAEALARHVDFFSIGTNDLIQYTMAADRTNDSVAHLYQPTNPAVLKLMRMTISAARKAGIGVCVCGESAADPVLGVLWAAMGADVLSMSSSYIPVISKVFSRLRRADLDEYDRLVSSLDPDLTAAEILSRCRAWLDERIPDLANILI